MKQRGLLWIVVIFAITQAACSTTNIATPESLASHPDAVSIPYRISSAGRIVLDVSINGNTPRPLILDTGANVSVLYDDYSEDLGLNTSGDTVLVRGLVSVGRRPIIPNVNIGIGSQSFQARRIAVLEKPPVTDGAVGLLGIDVLSDYVAVFDKETLRATFLPSKILDKRVFNGWRSIGLKNRTKGREDIGLHFAEATINRRQVPILIDTGSNTNFINWRFASLDNNIKRFERNLRQSAKLQGALGASFLKMNTVLFDLEIGQKYWPQIDVTVIELDPLSTIAPTDKPMMIAGAGMFINSTVAFDFGRDKIFMLPDPGDTKPPEHYWGYTPI